MVGLHGRIWDVRGNISQFPDRCIIRGRCICCGIVHKVVHPTAPVHPSVGVGAIRNETAVRIQTRAIYASIRSKAANVPQPCATYIVETHVGYLHYTQPMSIPVTMSGDFCNDKFSTNVADPVCSDSRVASQHNPLSIAS